MALLGQRMIQFCWRLMCSKFNLSFTLAFLLDNYLFRSIEHPAQLRATTATATATTTSPATAICFVLLRNNSGWKRGKFVRLFERYKTRNGFRNQKCHQTRPDQPASKLERGHTCILCLLLLSWYFLYILCNSL